MQEDGYAVDQIYMYNCDKMKVVAVLTSLCCSKIVETTTRSGNRVLAKKLKFSLNLFQIFSYHTVKAIT